MRFFQIATAGLIGIAVLSVIYDRWRVMPIDVICRHAHDHFEKSKGGSKDRLSTGIVVSVVSDRYRRSYEIDWNGYRRTTAAHSVDLRFFVKPVSLTEMHIFCEDSSILLKYDRIRKAVEETPVLESGDGKIVTAKKLDSSSY